MMVSVSALLQVARQDSLRSRRKARSVDRGSPGEVLRFEWRDIDWEARTLVVRGTKTKGSLRRIDLSEEAIQLLREHHRSELEKRLKLGPGATCGDGEATVFTNIVGKPVDAGGLKRTWKRIIRDAKVGHVRFHDLRHAAATYLLRLWCAHTCRKRSPRTHENFDHNRRIGPCTAWHGTTDRRPAWKSDGQDMVKGKGGLINVHEFLGLLGTKEGENWRARRDSNA